MSMIQIANLSFSYDGNSDPVFNAVNLQLDTKWKLGLIGRNGRGKTTLLKLMMGELRGTGTITSQVAFEYFPYPVAEPDAYTIDVIRTIALDVEDWEIHRECSLLDVHANILYQPYCMLSGGEQAKAMLAGLFLRKNAFLLIDEPTNHLDAVGRRLLGEYLNRKTGFILISHDRTLLDLCTDHILAIQRAGITLQKGNYSSWQENQNRQEAFEQAQNAKLQKDIHRLAAAAKRNAAWSDRAERAKIGFDPNKVEKSTARRPNEAAKAKKIMSRARAIAARQEKAIAEKKTLLHNLEETAELRLQPLVFHTKHLVQLAHLSIQYDALSVCHDICFTVSQGERIALLGRNGCGKSSILKLICGESIPHTGQIIQNGQLKISYVPQTTEHLRGSLQAYAAKLGVEQSLFFAILRKLDFSRTQFEQSLEHCSAGQKKKVLLAGSLCTQAHLYIWDEPLNYIDMISRLQIEQMILTSQATMLFVEHDAAFCKAVASRSIDLAAM